MVKMTQVTNCFGGEVFGSIQRAHRVRQSCFFEIRRLVMSPTSPCDFCHMKHPQEVPSRSRRRLFSDSQCLNSSWLAPTTCANSSRSLIRCVIWLKHRLKSFEAGLTYCQEFQQLRSIFRNGVQRALLRNGEGERHGCKRPHGTSENLANPRRD